MMLILLKTRGFLVSTTNVLTLLNKKIHFFQFCLFLVPSLHVDTAYLLKRSENQNTQTEPLSSL